MHISLSSLERENFKDSIIHKLDARVKLVLTLLIIFYITVYNNVFAMLLVEGYLIFLIILSRLSLLYMFKRIALILPFGGTIALFQPFIKGDTVIYCLFGMPIYQEGLTFGIILFLKVLVSVTGIVLLSSTTPMYEVINAARKLGLPKIMAMLLGLMVRYLFVMYDVLENTIKAQKSRGFNRKNLSYKKILHIFGYTVGNLFLRAYEQGEKTYLAMLSRCYSNESDLFLHKKKIGVEDLAMILITIIVLALGVFLF
ncbi:cobalt ECF transporter T component CbiQ [Methanotorris igneus]|uniref:Cobalt ABC transporter, inner membrane subunit CbiQ n=1 Tax=Methanotorris igneus (strain DSM 5666 / JCM 11834 / Kol 5) TaxID=880724 RepID=F6BBV5_METIK|nr:cobalt ECF transporter T component CbiQ [Methanotorris igneus]AEF97235.1 cobalt ABC transporter, inner membrane subunit CbiQ [Methanotorris igneus Kol 5]